ncbi:MAG: division/cell wall cluster transcriptional repressor MraZ [Acidobacteria bacterium]|nr:division/cell wall cluster transcriptional repressor MraZ [Acidobacteriota bacterium]
MFRGLQNGRVDEKYRLKFPAFVQKKLSEVYGSSDVFITSLDGKEMKIYPISEWEKVERTLAEKSTGGNTGDGLMKNKFSFLANHYGAEQSLDNQGRILIPVPLREGSGVGCEIKMVWQSNHLLALNEENYEKKMVQHTLSGEEMSYAADLGF